MNNNLEKLWDIATEYEQPDRSGWAIVWGAVFVVIFIIGVVLWVINNA